LPDVSESLRHQLISELDHLKDEEDLASWAHRALPLKNQLSASDAEASEAAFAVRLTHLGESVPVVEARAKSKRTAEQARF
jgi:hypothetical protein